VSGPGKKQEQPVRGMRPRQLLAIAVLGLVALAPAGATEPVQAEQPPAADAEGSTPEAAPAAPPAAAAPPVEIAMVRIAINATPWAMIEIDGVPVGETPLSDVSLPVGRHRFVARMPDGSVRERVIHVDGQHDAVVFD